MPFFKVRKYALQSFFAIFFLMAVDTFITSDLSSRKGLELVSGEGYLYFEIVIALVIIIGAIVLLLLNKSKLLRFLLIAYNILLTIALLDDVRSLMIALPKQTVGYAILLDAFYVWVSNLVIFALWYWIIDGGGPQKRNFEKERKYDLMFPQEQQIIQGWEKWKPGFVDYIFLSFYSSMAFTPTDTLILSRKMKFLLMLQATISVVVLAMIGARAINLLG